MALSEKPTSPFDGGEKETIKAEKAKVLDLVARYGSEGYEMYDNARSALQEHEAAVSGKIGSGRFAPVALLQSIAGRHSEALDAALSAVADLRGAEGDFYDKLSSSTGRVMDMALADESGPKLFDERQELFDSQTREAEANLREYALRAKPPERSSSSGGGGGGRGGGVGFARAATLPLGLLNEYTGVNLSRGSGIERGRAFTEGLRRSRGYTPSRRTPSMGTAGRSTRPRAGSAGRSTRRSGGGGGATYK